MNICLLSTSVDEMKTDIHTLPPPPLHPLSPQNRYRESRPSCGCFIAYKEYKEYLFRGSWVAQSVKQPTSAQVMISPLVSLSPASGSVLTAQSLETASDSVSPPLSAPPPLVLSLAL